MLPFGSHRRRRNRRRNRRQSVISDLEYRERRLPYIRKTLKYLSNQHRHPLFKRHVYQVLPLPLVLQDMVWQYYAPARLNYSNILSILGPFRTDLTKWKAWRAQNIDYSSDRERSDDRGKFDDFLDDLYEDSGKNEKWGELEKHVKQAHRTHNLLLWVNKRRLMIHEHCYILRPKLHKELMCPCGCFKYRVVLRTEFNTGFTIHSKRPQFHISKRENPYHPKRPVRLFDLWRKLFF